MSFPTETEKENKLSFLDAEVLREQGKFTTTVYRKTYQQLKKKALAPSPSILRNNIFAN